METVTNTQSIETVVKYSVQTKGKLQKANIMYANSPEEMESSRAQPASGAVASAEKHPSSGSTDEPDQQNNITEKHTEGRKGRACFWTVRTAVKRHFKSKVCPRVPDRESSQENPQTFRPEPTAVTDALESQPVLDYVQATQSSAVVSAESSSSAFEYLPVDVPEQQNKPTDVPEQPNNIAEKHTEGRKGRACFWTVRKAVKRPFKTKVCPLVPDRESSQENPQTFRPEPTAVTDALESQPVLGYVQATQSSAVVSAESSSNAFEDLPVDVPEQQNKPTDVPEQQNNIAEKHTEGRKDRNCFRTVWTALKRHFKTKVCPHVPDREPSEEIPETSRPEPTAVTDPLESQPVFETKDQNRPEPTAVTHPRLVLTPRTDVLQRLYTILDRDRALWWRRPPSRCGVQCGAVYFCSLYKVGVELLVEYFSCLHEGIRRSDGHKVLVKFAGRRWLENRYRCRGDIPPCYEAEIMFALQRPPSCDHIIRLYDWFPLQDHDILVMEHPYPCVTLADFDLQNTGRLDEEITRRIMFQLIVAERHCLDRGVLHDTCLREILINTDTLQIKLMQFARAKFTAPADDITFLDPMIRVATILETARNLRAVLGALIEEFSPWDLQHLSIDCRNFLWTLGCLMINSLEDLIDHPWLRDLSTANEGEGN